jgi:hypothetical protein
LLQNIVYCAYAFLIVYIDRVAQPAVNDAYPGGDDDYYYDTAPYHEASERLYNLYTASAVIHLLNAFMYIWAWLPLGFSLVSVVMVPEWLNVAGAACYLYTSTLYSKADGTYLDDVTFTIHHYETAAAAIELVAAVGWVTTWWLTFPRKTVGRGWTLDDPDVWANAGIVLPSVLYVVYNAQILADPLSYATNTLYVTGNAGYAAGAVFYLVAALRDDGYFRCLPTGGVCPYGLDAVTILDPMGTGNAYPTADQVAAARRAGLRKYPCNLPPLSKWPCCGGGRGDGDDARATMSVWQRLAAWAGRNCTCRRRAEAQSLLGRR